MIFEKRGFRIRSCDGNVFVEMTAITYKPTSFIDSMPFSFLSGIRPRLLEERSIDELTICGCHCFLRYNVLDTSSGNPLSSS